MVKKMSKEEKRRYIIRKSMSEKELRDLLSEASDRELDENACRRLAKDIYNSSSEIKRNSRRIEKELGLNESALYGNIDFIDSVAVIEKMSKYLTRPELVHFIKRARGFNSLRELK